MTTEQFLWEQIKKGTGCLQDIFMDARSVEHDMVLYLYATGTQMTILLNDRWEESTHNNTIQQSQGTGSGTYMSDVKPDSCHLQLYT